MTNQEEWEAGSAARYEKFVAERPWWPVLERVVAVLVPAILVILLPAMFVAFVASRAYDAVLDTVETLRSVTK